MATSWLKKVRCHNKKQESRLDACCCCFWMLKAEPHPNRWSWTAIAQLRTSSRKTLGWLPLTSGGDCQGHVVYLSNIAKGMKYQIRRHLFRPKRKNSLSTWLYYSRFLWSRRPMGAAEARPGIKSSGPAHCKTDTFFPRVAKNQPFLSPCTSFW